MRTCGATGGPGGVVGGVGGVGGVAGGAGGVGGVAGGAGCVGGEIGRPGVDEVWMADQVLSNHLDRFPRKNARLDPALGAGAAKAWMGSQDDQVLDQDVPATPGVVREAPEGRRSTLKKGQKIKPEKFRTF